MEPLYSKNILIKDLLGVIAQSLKKEDSDKKCYDHILKEFETSNIYLQKCINLIQAYKL